MRHLISAISIILGISSLHAEDYRTWTETEYGRTIEAKIVDKKLDDSKAKLMIKSGKVFWLESAKLSKEDQEHIKQWHKPVDNLSVRIRGYGKGVKEIEITATAGSRPVTVKVYWSAVGSQPSGFPKVHEIGKGEQQVLIYSVSNKYVVKAFVGDELVDEESWNRKTGL